jgi:hypothetical protein
MNYNRREYPAVLMSRMRDWDQLARSTIDQATKARAKKNLRYLVDKYPNLAKRAGVTQ